MSRNTAERDLQVLELRRAGLTFDRIAKQLGFANKGSASKAYARAIERADSALSLTDARVLEVDRLDRLLSVLWPKANRGDLAAVDRILKISKRRSEILGLDVARHGPSERSSSPAPPPSGQVVVGANVLKEMRERRAAEAAARVTEET